MREAWSITRTTDPITGETTCVVSAYDQAAGMRFSRVGALYPIVENSPKFGLLVGISSGGSYRIPTGDILWRVDDLPHRELRAADNPKLGGETIGAAYKTGNEAADRAISDAMAATSGLTAAMVATSTVASGNRAREMLTEMIAGRALIFRPAAAAPAFGLPSGATYNVGQVVGNGLKAELKPIPIDASFHRGLTECGIAPRSH